MIKKAIAITGLVAITFAMAACDTDKNETSAITQEKAVEIALAEVEGATSDEVTSVKYESEDKDYDVEILHEGYEYSFEVSEDGSIVSAEKEKAESQDIAEDDSYIGIDKAIKIALGEVKGATEKDVVKSTEDYDDGITVYEIEIVYNEYEYDFEIEAETGNILEKDSESIYED